MNKEFIPYKQALALKELGFDEPCFKCKVIGQEHLDYTPSDYDDFPEQKEVEVLIPTFSQAFRWFRENKLSDACICRYQSRDDGGIYFYYVINHDYGIEETRHFKEGFFSYEEAELACLDKLIEIVKL